MSGPLSLSFSSRRGFTLVEMLVAVAILALILVLMMQITTLTGISVDTGGQKALAAQAARTAFDRIGIDWDSRLRRNDLVPFIVDKVTGNDSIRFYSQVNGFGGDRSVTLVGYRISGSTSALPYSQERGAQGSSWSSGSNAASNLPFLTGTLPLISDTNYQTLSPDVCRMEICWQLKATGTSGPGTIVATPPTDPSTIGAMIVSIAVLDKRSRKQVSPSSIQAAMDKLEDADPNADPNNPGETTPLWQWSQTLLSQDFQDKTKTPKPISQNLRIYQRFYYAD